MNRVGLLLHNRTVHLCFDINLLVLQDGGMVMFRNKLFVIIKYINIANLLIQSVNLCAIIYALISEYRNGKIVLRFEIIPLEYLIFWVQSSLIAISISLISVVVLYVLQHKGTIYRWANISLVVSIIVFGFYFRKICGL